MFCVSWFGWMVWFEVDYEYWYTKPSKDRTVGDNLCGWLFGFILGVITPIALPFVLPYVIMTRTIGFVGGYIRNNIYRREVE